jgi:Uma2 family endonuclease
MNALEPQKKRWTTDEYYELADLGWFRDQRVELIDGEIIEMPPQKDTHFMAIGLTAEALAKAFGDGYWVRIQGPLHLGESSEPEPDVAVVKGTIRDYAGAGHPTAALLVVEVSDTTLRYARGDKASFYAAHGIADYWVVNLRERRLEVYRDPIADTKQRFGYRFENIVHYSQAETAALLAAPAAAVVVADLLP